MHQHLAIYYIDWAADSEFNKRFEERFGKAPVLNAIDGYKGMRATIKVLLAVRKDLVKELNKLNYQGIAGPIDFSKGVSGNLAPAKLFRIADGGGAVVR